MIQYCFTMSNSDIYNYKPKQNLDIAYTVSTSLQCANGRLLNGEANGEDC